ncbi:hypothetical protein TRICI_002600 [Trichomonascus ciferrii]|uniref:Phosphatidic acid phosphatase type 2/haloperoxidase domain-containing protein n=1 Tax=Trichomonascus ciferrii TaxID=44093 RepID=A0A642VBA9_9ASCO|nr:hypothetical protein TRICI_002600 [Trichomonascus ciferrii]
MAANADDDILPFPTLQPNPLPQREEPEKASSLAAPGAVGEPTPTPTSASEVNESSRASSTTGTTTPNGSSSLTSLLAAYERKPDADKDAGNRPLDHYKARLPAWRNSLRNAVLPLIRWETPHLAEVQRWARTPALDVYFGLTANLGTHTFYVISLPLGFWVGAPGLARSIVFVLAFGVFLTGVLKDLLCLPRPLSPPLHRISMSGSAALEYGFPSTHTANAVSVGLLVNRVLVDNMAPGPAYYTFQGLNVLYVLSITLGRVYCGMHGFLDVLTGAVIGALLYWARMTSGPAVDRLLLAPGAIVPIVAWVLAIIVAVRLHPEPADDCPCFDDAVAFMGVMAGMAVGQWCFAAAYPGSNGGIPYDLQHTGATGTALRLVLGVALIAVWRPTMKRALHRLLPPLFRSIERHGLSMPRRFFTPASEYKNVPAKIADATFVEPYAFSSLFSGMRRAKRADSVGPQSTADVYESIAYRRYKKQDEPATKEDELKEAEMLSQVVRPRVKYDVEVVTKLIVYAGVAIIATHFCGVLFLILNI